MGDDELHEFATWEFQAQTVRTSGTQGRHRHLPTMQQRGICKNHKAIRGGHTFMRRRGKKEAAPSSCHDASLAIVLGLAWDLVDDGCDLPNGRTISRRLWWEYVLH